MGEAQPSRKTPKQVAKDSARRNETESAFHARCLLEGVHPEDAIGYWQRLCAEKRKIPAFAIPSGTFLEQRFKVDNTIPKKLGGQGWVEFGSDAATGVPVGIKHLTPPPDLAFGQRCSPAEVEAIQRIPRCSPALRWNLIEYLAVGQWDQQDQKYGIVSLVMP